MAAGVNTLSRTFVWILLGLVVVGLAGFGALNLTGTVRTVATIGDQTISTNDYARELQRELRAFEAQIGQPLPLEQARLLGLDQIALSRLVALASLDNEVAELGLSIGDVNLQKEIIAIPAFNGVNGEFDRESYRFSLQQVGLTEAEFEADLRAEAARTLVQGAIVSGVVMPREMVDTIAKYVAARRSFTMLRLDASGLTRPPADPSDTDLRAYYDANPDDFTLPETKRLSYVLMTPTMLLDQVEVDDAALQTLYDERFDQYNVPERRLVERLVFPDEASATDARTRLEAGDTTFEDLVISRGLSMVDVDMGDLSRDDLDEGSDEVFGAEVGSVIGPVPSALGPALYRINGSLSGRVTSLDDARTELNDELAGDRARRLIEAQAEDINDLLAGGATLRELAIETDMQLGEIDWTALSFDGVAAYEEFRAAAASVTEEDFPEVAYLDDGGIFALQLNEVLPVRPEPFEQARERVSAAWTLSQTETALRAQADELTAQLATDGDFAATGRDFSTETGLTRTAFLDGTPADFMNQVFEMEPQELRVINGDGVVFLVRLDEVLPPDETSQYRASLEAIGEQMNQTLSQALFDAFVRDAQTRARPSVDQRAVNAVDTNVFGGAGGAVPHDPNDGHTH